MDGRVTYIVDRNGEISFNRKEFQQTYGYMIETCQKARNLLIEVGLIKLEKTGGQGRGDMHKYSILYDCYPKEERWKKYPNKDWKHEVPQYKGRSLGNKWAKGESGNPKYKSQSSKVDTKSSKPSTKVEPNNSESIYSDRPLNGIKNSVSDI